MIKLKNVLFLNVKKVTKTASSSLVAANQTKILARNGRGLANNDKGIFWKEKRSLIFILEQTQN